MSKNHRVGPVWSLVFSHQALRTSPARRQQLLQLLVAVVEAFFELIEDPPRRHQKAQQAARRLELNPVGDDDLTESVRVEDVLVYPAGEQAANLRFGDSLRMHQSGDFMQHRLHLSETLDFELDAAPQ